MEHSSAMEASQAHQTVSQTQADAPGKAGGRRGSGVEPVITTESITAPKKETSAALERR